MYYENIIRTICLGTTDGLSTTWSGFFILYQLVIVPVGAITLGRILSVVGSILDPYIEIFNSVTFSNITGVYKGHSAKQSIQSNKVVVWDVVNSKWDDIEWDTIISWEKVNEGTIC